MPSHKKCLRIAHCTLADLLPTAPGSTLAVLLRNCRSLAQEDPRGVWLSATMRCSILASCATPSTVMSAWPCGYSCCFWQATLPEKNRNKRDYRWQAHQHLVRHPLPAESHEGTLHPRAHRGGSPEAAALPASTARSPTLNSLTRSQNCRPQAQNGEGVGSGWAVR